MSPDQPDDDRTVIRPTVTGGPDGFAPTAVYTDKTQIAAGPPPSAPAVPPPEDMGNGLPVGTRLGEFEITSLVGEGGFGLVYSAHDHALGRRVALKEYMPSSLAGRTPTSQVQVKSERHRDTFEAGRKSFVNEARLLAQFDHPSLVKVYRFWEGNGTAYMVMPFLEGKTLRDILAENRRAGNPPPDEAWLRSVLGPLTEALLVIHAEQCYHRDIAPDNVMQLPNGRWLLLDFGAARRVIGDMTQALTVILKPGYAPVEQYAEIPGMKQGPWTDVYALAAVVYNAIVGRTPPPSVGRMLNDTYVPMVKAGAGRYSEEFLAAIDRALKVRPEERTQSIGELRQQLGLAPVAMDPFATQTLTLGLGSMPAAAAPGAAAATARTLVQTVPPPAAPHAPVLPPGDDGPTIGIFTPPPAPAPPPARPPAVAAPVAVPRAAPAAASPAAPAAQKKGSGALIGAGVGVVVLGAAAFFLLGRSPAPAPTPAAAPAVAAAPAAPAPAPAAAPAPPPAPISFDAERELDRVVAGQSSGFDLRAEAVKSDLRIGTDEFKFSVTSGRDGHLYVLGLGPDGTLAQLVPNGLSGPSVRLRKGQTWRFPTADRFVLHASDPPGRTQLLVIVSERARSFDGLQLQSGGVIKLFPAQDVMNGLIAAHKGAAPLLAGSSPCPAGAATCSDAYGAALLRFNSSR